MQTFEEKKQFLFDNWNSLMPEEIVLLETFGIKKSESDNDGRYGRKESCNLL